ncbi:MAG: hypothetical protein WCP77_10040 [Roseococcus sp.]
MSHLVLLGDSHASIYAEASSRLGAPLLGGPLGGANFFTPDVMSFGPDGVTFVGAGATRFERLARRARINSLAECRGRLVISFGMAAARFYGSQDWTRMDFGPNPSPKKGHLSEGVLDAIVADLQVASLALIQNFLEQGLIVAALTGSPPQARHRAVLALGPQPVMNLVAKYEAPIRALLASAGIPIIAPPGVTDENGLLLEHFWSEDNNHGNLLYGEQVIAELLRVVRRSGALPSLETATGPMPAEAAPPIPAAAPNP